jgi:hypothetical protein
MSGTRAYRAFDNAASKKASFVLMCVCLVCFGGCGPKKRPTFNYGAVALAHPVMPVSNAESELEAPPDIPLEIGAPPRLVVPRRAVPKPRVVAPPPAESSVEEKSVEPVIAPELSPTELSAAQGKTQSSLKVAETNLALVNGKTLNAEQEDVVSKVRGFMDRAREAMKIRDWQRAGDLAKKAAELSQELAGTF